ncbi:MAG: M3 family metallopeptidase [Thermoanaerobaculia bacterium]
MSTLAVDAPLPPAPEPYEERERERLRSADGIITRLLRAGSSRTIENTLEPFDDAMGEIDSVGSHAGLVANVHPDAPYRAAAERIGQEAQAAAARLGLNRALYDALASLDVSHEDAATRHYVEKTLRDFRLSGVTRDEATRQRVQELRDELVLIGQEFLRNIRSDRRTVTVHDASELAGLPADYIAQHAPAADGTITLTIDTPDSLPVLLYAENEELRKRMFMEYNNRAFPANDGVLARMLSLRHELAQLLGFPTWADFITADKMVKSAGNVAEFIDRIAEASRAAAEREFTRLLSCKRTVVPDAERIEAWESSFWSERLRRAEYDSDSQAVRPYFAYERVKNGLLRIAGDLFGVAFRRIEGAPVWHDSVELWEMHGESGLIGRFYLDMHPRSDKYNHAAAFPVQTGASGKRLPVATLVCNFPGGRSESGPGFLQHSDVVTFFHEFGHLLHFLFGGHQRWIGVGGFATEHDFIEAPSQMLEEWTWDAGTLATFARHHETDETIPAALVQRMRQAHEFGKALGVRRQMLFARLSLSLHAEDPASLDVGARVESLTRLYQPFPFVPGTHFHTGFGHLEGYSAVYYTYMWSLVIAKDLFSAFSREDLLAPEVARRYRDLILAAGGSAPADVLVRRFLDRPFDFEAWERWLNEG